eukprot:3442390-Lingulodinium_polyedra.AAC.1
MHLGDFRSLFTSGSKVDILTQLREVMNSLAHKGPLAASYAQVIALVGDQGHTLALACSLVSSGWLLLASWLGARPLVWAHSLFSRAIPSSLEILTEAIHRVSFPSIE